MINRRPRARAVTALLAAALLLPSCGGRKVPEAHSPDRSGGVKVGFREKGEASWYGPKFHGRTTANGEKYNMFELTAAHKSLPFGTRVKVTHLDSGREVVVRINDRGPFKRGRIIDLSYEAAKRLKITRDGVARVRIEVISFPGRSG